MLASAGSTVANASSTVANVATLGLIGGKTAKKKKLTKEEKAKLFSHVSGIGRKDERKPDEEDKKRERFHNHTFMRQNGHIISAKSKGSQILARLRMVSYLIKDYPEPSKEYSDKMLAKHPELAAAVKPPDPEKASKWEINRAKAGEPRVLNNFATIKFSLRNELDKRIVRSQIVWSAPQTKCTFSEPGEVFSAGPAG